MSELSLSPAEQIQINAQRAKQAANMHHAGTDQAQLQMTVGPCSVDMNRIPETGELGAVDHGRQVAAVAKTTTSSLVVVRYVYEKPRTNTGFPGIIHEAGGLEAYVEGAHQLHAAGVPLASEVMGENNADILVPHLTQGWVGAREVAATSPRYAVRPTIEQLDNGVHPLPTWVKSGQNGSLTHTMNALTTIMSEKPQTRLQNGKLVTTHANPHTGVILRGHDVRPNGPLRDILEDEIGTARELLDSEYGKDVVPIMVDTSHGHAKYEGGGEAGQLAIAEALGDLIIMGARIDGIMAETHLLSGKQKEGGTVAGLSITDACIGQQNTATLLTDMNLNWEMTSASQSTRV